MNDLHERRALLLVNRIQNTIDRRLLQVFEHIDRLDNNYRPI